MGDVCHPMRWVQYLHEGKVLDVYIYNKDLFGSSQENVYLELSSVLSIYYYNQISAK